MTSDKKKIEQAKKMIYKYYDILDKTGENTKIAKSRIEGMSNAELARYIQEGIFQLYSDPLNKKQSPTIRDIHNVLRFVKRKAEEKISLPFLGMDEDGNALMSDKEVLIVEVNVNRLQQMVSKESVAASDSVTRDKTNQAIGKSKAAIMSDNDIAALAAKGGFDNCLVELLSVRADNMVAKDEAYTQASSTGLMTIPESAHDTKNKTTLNYVSHLYLALGISINLVEDLDKM